MPYVVAGGRGIGICAVGTQGTPSDGNPDSDLLDAVLGTGNVDDAGTPVGAGVEGDCRPGSLGFGFSSTAIADPLPPDPPGPPTAMVFDLEPLGVSAGRSEFIVSGATFLSSVAPARGTGLVAWILPFDPTGTGQPGTPLYDWGNAPEPSGANGAANISSSILTAYTDDTSPSNGGSTVSRVSPSISSAFGATRLQLPLWIAIYDAGDRCRLDAGNPGGCVDPFASGYQGSFTRSQFNAVASDVFGAPVSLHTVASDAPVLGVLPFSLDLVSAAATSRVMNPGGPLGGFSSKVTLNDPLDPRSGIGASPFGTGELAGVAAGAFLNGDYSQANANNVHAQYVLELGFVPVSMLADPPVPSPLPTGTVADQDQDGIPDASDNCPFEPNADQLDRGRIGGSGADGIGDACQCGDVTGDGSVSIADALVIRRSLLNPPTATPAKPELCDVGGTTGCSIADALIIQRQLLVPPTAFVGQQCPPAVGP